MNHKLKEEYKDFIKYYNWFDKKRRDKLSFRWPSFKAALNLFLQRDGEIIVETGCARMENDYGAGMSSLIFGDFCNQYNKKLYTIDISFENIETCKRITKDFSNYISYNIGDSITYLKNFNKKIDLLYLDSYDYNLGELLELYGGRENVNKAMEILNNMSENEVVNKHGHIFADCQNHCLNELLFALPKLHNKSIILIDDAMLAGGGKPKLAKEWLFDNGWECILDSQQTLWIKQ